MSQKREPSQKKFVKNSIIVAAIIFPLIAIPFLIGIWTIDDWTYTNNWTGEKRTDFEFSLTAKIAITIFTILIYFAVIFFGWRLYKHQEYKDMRMKSRQNARRN